MEDDKYIIIEISKGNVKAFDKLYEKYSKAVYGFSLSYLKSEVEAEGVVQDVFMYIWSNRKNLRTDTSIKSYLFTISSNLIKKIFRRESYSNRFKKGLDKSEIDALPDDILEYNLLLEKVDYLLESLPPRRREIFLMSRKLGNSSKEISEELGITVGAVDNQISQVIKFLRLQLGKELQILVVSFYFFFH